MRLVTFIRLQWLKWELRNERSMREYGLLPHDLCYYLEVRGQHWWQCRYGFTGDDTPLPDPQFYYDLLRDDGVPAEHAYSACADAPRYWDAPF